MRFNLSGKKWLALITFGLSVKMAAAQNEIQDLDRAVDVMKKKIWREARRCEGDSCYEINDNRFYYLRGFFTTRSTEMRAQFSLNCYAMKISEASGELTRDNSGERRDITIQILDAVSPFHVTYYAINGKFAMTMTVSGRQISFKCKDSQNRIHEQILVPTTAPKEMKTFLRYERRLR